MDGQLETVDELIDILMTKLYERNLQNCINIIIIADHGRILVTSLCFTDYRVIFSNCHKKVPHALALKRDFGLNKIVIREAKRVIQK